MLAACACVCVCVLVSCYILPCLLCPASSCVLMWWFCAVVQAIMEQEAKIQSFKTALLSSQDTHQSNMTKDMERQQSFLDKMRVEVRSVLGLAGAEVRLVVRLARAGASLEVTYL